MATFNKKWKNYFLLEATGWSLYWHFLLSKDIGEADTHHFPLVTIRGLFLSENKQEKKKNLNFQLKQQNQTFCYLTEQFFCTLIQVGRMWQIALRIMRLFKLLTFGSPLFEWSCDKSDYSGNLKNKLLGIQRSKPVPTLNGLLFKSWLEWRTDKSLSTTKYAKSAKPKYVVFENTNTHYQNTPRQK